MKIKNLKYILCLIFGVILFANGVSLGSSCCTTDYTANSGSCTWTNIACTGSSEQYDNDPNHDKPQDLDRFLAIINEQRNTCSADDVARIQGKMQQIGGACSTCKDGKAGSHTRQVISACVNMLCEGDGLMTPIFNGSSLSCESTDYSLVPHSQYNLTYQCCQEIIPYEPGYPVITNTNHEREGGVAHITVQYLDDDSDKVDSWDSNPANFFNANVGSINNVTTNQGSLSVTFDVTNIGDDVTSITVNVLPGLITFTGGVPSNQGSANLPRDVPEPENTGNCPEAPENGSCGEGCAIVGGSSCAPAATTCGDNQAAPGGGACAQCETGTIPNEEHTKCICDSSKKCCGIQLNTVVPFIGDCIELDTDSSRGDTTSVNSVTAFPILMQGLMKILMSVIMVFSFIMVIVSGLMMTAGAFKSSSFDKGKSILKNVLISLILLGCSGLILSLINPSFFGG